MLKRWLGPPSVTLVVDDGKVFCPVEVHDVDVDRCLSCPQRTDFHADEAGTVTLLVCTPRYRALVGR